MHKKFLQKSIILACLYVIAAISVAQNPCAATKHENTLLAELTSENRGLLKHVMARHRSTGWIDVLRWDMSSDISDPVDWICYDDRENEMFTGNTRARLPRYNTNKSGDWITQLEYEKCIKCNYETQRQFCPLILSNTFSNKLPSLTFTVSFQDFCESKTLMLRYWFDGICWEEEGDAMNGELQEAKNTLRKIRRVQQNANWVTAKTGYLKELATLWAAARYLDQINGENDDEDIPDRPNLNVEALLEQGQFTKCYVTKHISGKNTCSIH